MTWVLVIGTALLLLTGTSESIAAQGSTPVAYPVAPAPPECRAEPRPMADVLAVVGPPGASTPVPATPTAKRGTLPAGVPADEPIAAAGMATLYNLFACTNAGDFLRVFSFFTDDFLRDFLAGTPLTDEVVALFEAPARALPAEQQRVIVRFGQPVLLEDGRLGVPIVLDEPDDPRTEEPDFAILEMVGGRWLVDEIIEDVEFDSGPAAGTPHPNGG